jgi:hypothetical protein
MLKKLVKERKENLESFIKNVDKDFEQYKDLEIPARQGNSIRAIRM